MYLFMTQHVATNPKLCYTWVTRETPNPKPRKIVWKWKILEKPLNTVIFTYPYLPNGKANPIKKGSKFWKYCQTEFRFRFSTQKSVLNDRWFSRQKFQKIPEKKLIVLLDFIFANWVILSKSFQKKIGPDSKKGLFQLF